MKFEPTALVDVVRIEPSPHVDARGSFARLYCPDAFRDAGIAFTSTQINVSHNSKRLTLRGMHFQDAPYAEAKIVRVVRGAAFDVVVDLRPESPTHKKWIGVELSAERGTALFLPEGCAHGFLTLEDATDVLYQMGRAYVPGHARGVRWNDPAFAIGWPESPAIIDAKDQSWPDYLG